MSISTLAPRYEVAAYAATLPAPHRDGFACFALIASYARVIRRARSAPGLRP